MEGGDGPEVEPDGTWMEVWYFCEACNDWAQVPWGFVAVVMIPGKYISKL